MNMAKSLVVAVIILGFIALPSFMACQKKVEVHDEALIEVPAPEVEVPAPEVEVSEDPVSLVQVEVPIYERQVEPLSPEECARCHLHIFDNIREAGGKHRIECQECHTVFHTKEDIMPECSACHKDEFHGQDPLLTECLSCHDDPHRPLDIPKELITDNCAKCHVSEKSDLVNHPSMHLEALECSSCHHTKHGYVPDCYECHGNHSPRVQMEMQECMGCHPAHKPLTISYSPHTSSEICAGCHGTPYELLVTKVSRHSYMTCAQCHPAHEQIDPCSQCHFQPHSQTMIRDRTCQDCHGLAHSLAID